MSWVTKFSEKMEGLKKGLGWSYPKTRKCMKEGLTTVSGGHRHLQIRSRFFFTVTAGGAKAVSEGFRSRMKLSLLQLSNTALEVPTGSQQDTAGKRLYPFPCP